MDVADGDEYLAEECEVCGSSAGICFLSHCPGCSSTYCDDCWKSQLAHKREKHRRGPSMHDKVSLGVIRRYQGSINPTRDPHLIQKLHEEDQKTGWFGVAREESQTIFEDFGRYATLASDMTQFGDITKRYPKLVSFIGVTNAGKSTLIKMLIERCGKDFPSPVVGSAANDALTTTAGTHMYADPASHGTGSPLLWVDCEGFDGGETSPLGSQCQGRNQGGRNSDKWTSARPIKWASTEETCKREFTVTTLYPRILYTFSDCVVFVLRNPKTFASAVLTKLIAWGAAALETSVNQPALPHCIVVLNGSDPGIDQCEWITDHATESLLSTVSNALDRIEGVPQFREASTYWRKLGKRIDTIEDLLLCYYGTFKVVRVPAGPQYTLIDQQINELHAAISAACDLSHATKRTARLLTNADELGCYLESGIDHFITHLDIPFNFMQVSLARNPIPQNFGGHILQLCETLSSRIPGREPAEIQWMLQQLCSVLASCVLLDCARFRKGQLDKLFENYVRFFEDAIAGYLQLHCPCSFTNPDGTRVCKSVKARHHVKGHQDEQGIIAAGEYMSPFDDDFAQQWMEQLRLAIGDLQLSFSRDVEKVAQSECSEPLSEEDIAFAFHSRNLRQFYKSLGPSTIRNNSTCLCCVMKDPQHPLPCGHVLCDWCVRACGKLNGTVLRVSWCPLHRDFVHWKQPKIIRYKPSEAGARVLALDGGGIRGVMQLEILRGIEQAIGNRLPVQAFFDLMVGTGTGGLIAVALARKDCSLDKCQKIFAETCKSAYTARNPGEALMTRFARAFRSQPQYKTSPVYEALQREFNEKSDFFGNSEQFRPEAKTAVTTIDTKRQKVRLVANYRRESEESSWYDFERSQSPAEEWRIWQAVYATMANARHFAPFKHYSGGKPECPALLAYEEAKKIWPDSVDLDMLLSLGTGQDRMAILSELACVPADTDSTVEDPWPRAWLNKAHKSTKWLLRHDKDVLEAERGWRDFVAAHPQEGTHRTTRRFFRFNIDFGQEEPPPQDRESHIRRISALARDTIQETTIRAALKNVAYRLVATSFFFHVQIRAGESVNGCICCRFEKHSDEIRGLAGLLKDRSNVDFEPYFTIRSMSGTGKVLLHVGITPDMLRTMIERGTFEPPRITFPIVNDNDEISINLHLLKHDSLETKGYPISGFPRQVTDNVSASRPPSTAWTERSKRPCLGVVDREDTSDIGLGSSPVWRAAPTSQTPKRQTLDVDEKIRADMLGAIARDDSGTLNDSPPPYM